MSKNNGEQLNADCEGIYEHVSNNIYVNTNKNLYWKYFNSHENQFQWQCTTIQYWDRFYVFANIQLNSDLIAGQTVSGFLGNSNTELLTIKCFGTKYPTKTPSNIPSKKTLSPTTGFPTLNTINPSKLPTISPLKLTTKKPTQRPTIKIIKSNNHSIIDGVNINLLLIVIGIFIIFCIILCIIKVTNRNKFEKLKEISSNNKNVMKVESNDNNNIQNEKTDKNEIENTESMINQMNSDEESDEWEIQGL